MAACAHTVAAEPQMFERVAHTVASTQPLPTSRVAQTIQQPSSTGPRVPVMPREVAKKAVAEEEAKKAQVERIASTMSIHRYSRELPPLDEKREMKTSMVALRSNPAAWETYFSGIGVEWQDIYKRVTDTGANPPYAFGKVAETIIKYLSQSLVKPALTSTFVGKIISSVGENVLTKQITVGRHPMCEIVLTNPKVSRVVAIFKRIEGTNVLAIVWFGGLCKITIQKDHPALFFNTDIVKLIDLAVLKDSQLLIGFGDVSFTKESVLLIC